MTALSKQHPCGWPAARPPGSSVARRWTREERWLPPPIDVHKRPDEGTDNAEAAMRGYLEWEYGLIARIANDGIAGFRVVRPATPVD